MKKKKKLQSYSNTEKNTEKKRERMKNAVIVNTREPYPTESDIPI